MNLRLMKDEDIGSVTRADLLAYVEYLTYYFRDSDAESGDPGKALINNESAIKRKLCAIRSMYDYLFKAQRIAANVTTLVDLPKIHEKPILRLDQKEMERILHIAETGDDLTDRQKAYQQKTAKRDYALLSLFLGTGIRVSECVGINL